jgi:hypothetical protein
MISTILVSPQQASKVRLRAQLVVLLQDRKQREAELKTCEQQHGAIVPNAGPASGLIPGAPAIPAAELPAAPRNEAPHQITGILLEINGSTLSIQTRAGETVSIDDTEAARAQQIGVLLVGKAFIIQGKYDEGRKLHATSVSRAKESDALWPPDR